ncbi:MAG: hypothetical protein WC522_06895 [Candidatus Omnitrophota bacterium]
MRSKIVSMTGVLILILFTAGAAAVFADDARSYEQLSPNGKYVFVMLTKSPDKGGKVDMLKTRYKNSGLYQTSNLRKSLWTVNWYSRDVHIASDGIHLVRIGRSRVSAMNAKPDMGQLALAFYEKGIPVRKYVIKDLASNPAKLTKSGGLFEWYKRIAFDDASQTLEVALVTGQTKIFDIKSGKIISTRTNTRKKESR